MSIHYYGENSFTFKLFQSLHKEKIIKDVLIRNLKSFERGAQRKFPMDVLSTTDEEEIQVYLFPCFGKKTGFGEPDVLMVAGDCTFWFEVETKIDFTNLGSDFRNSILQLMRFRLFAEAVERGPVVKKTYKAIIGLTIQDSGEPRDAVVALARHKVLAAIKDKIKQSVKTGKDYYVLMTVHEPTGIGKNNKTIFIRLKEEIFKSCYQKLNKCDSGFLFREPDYNKQFYYVYWEGDLNQKYDKRGLEDPLGDEYIEKKSKRCRSRGKNKKK